MITGYANAVKGPIKIDLFHMSKNFQDFSQTKMRILVIGPADSPHLARPVRSLLNKGHEIFLIGYHADDPFPKADRTKYMWFIDPGREPFPVSEKGMRDAFTLLSSVFKAFKPDVVHIHWLSWHLLPCSKIAPQCPLIVSIWGSDLNNALERTSDSYTWGNRVETVNAKNLHLANHIIIDDPTMIGKCAFAAPNVPVSLLPLGADEVFFHPDNRNAERIVKSMPQNNMHIFTSMRLVRNNYRPLEVLRAFAVADKSKNALLVFKKFLADRQTLLQVEDEANRLGISGQIIFIDDLEPEDLRDLYFASTALINFPEKDAFPVSFAEAAAVGCDVITCPQPSYDVRLVRECFEVLPEDSVEALSNAIRKRLDAPVSIASQNDIAIDMARKQYSHSAYINGLEKIYKVLSRGNA